MPKAIKKNIYDLKNTTIGTDSSGRSYRLTKGADLRLYLKFKGTLEDASGYNGVSKTVAYEGSVERTAEKIGHNIYPAARFDNSENLNALVTYSSTTNDLSFGNSTTDSPFSVSFLYRRVTAYADATNEYLLAKSNGSTSNLEFQLIYDVSNQHLILYLYDGGSSKFIRKNWTLPLTTVNDNWAHICVAYDGRGGSSAFDGMNAYINGVALATASTGGSSGGNVYVAMHSVGAKLYVGAYLDGSNEADGRFAEFAFFASQLSIDEARAIYYATINQRYKSGIISLPVRQRIKIKDNSTGSYPTVLRSGDTRTGTYGVSFNDTNTLRYGKKVTNNFEINFRNTSNDIPISPLVENQYFSASEGMQLRQEVIFASSNSISGVEKITKNALVFSGFGTAGERWIKTKQKYKNPEMSFEFLQGPYNLTEGMFKPGLNLKAAGNTAYSLKVQVSNLSEGGTWTTVKTLSVLGMPGFSSFKSITREFIANGEDSTITLPLNKGLAKNASEQVTFKIKLTPEVLKYDRLGTEFYIRIVQTSFNGQRTNWAIKNLVIEDRSQTVTYPVLINPNTTAGNKAISKYVATPNVIGDLSVKARSVSGISDNEISFTPGQDIKPFNEINVIEDASDTFFNEGTNADNLPGFDSPLFSKTKFTVDLSPSSETTFGMTTNHTSDPGSSTVKDGRLQQLLVYWNNNLKRWEKIGRGISFNSSSDGSVINHTSFLNMVQNGVCGFGNYGTVTTGSSTLASDILSEEVLNSLNRPISQFGFPFSGKYHATGSQYVTAKSLGINQPFLLEKCFLSFDAKLQTPIAGGTGNKVPYSLKHAYSHTGGSAPSTVSFGTTHHRLIAPTFFILRQSKGSIDTKVGVNVEAQFNAHSSTSFNTAYQVKIPDNYFLSTSPNKTYIDDVRELVTYGQISFFYSGSNSIYSSLNINKFLESSLTRDESVLFNSISLSNTGSFKIRFPCRTTSRYSNVSNTYVMASTSHSIVHGLRLGSEDIGNRSISQNDIVNSRAKTNNVSSKTLGTETLFPATSIQSDPTLITPAKLDTFDKTSPYIILPEDKLIFGWQYPLPIGLFYAPSNTDTQYNSMTLFGNSQLHLYGSLVKQGKEFHNTLNQNLSSNAVHEIIGAESVVDDYRIGERGEYAFSYNDRGVDNSATLPKNRVGSETFSKVLTGSITGSFNRFTSHFDSQKIYKDSVYGPGYFFAAGYANVREGDNTFNATTGKKFFVSSSYGTMQTNGKAARPRHVFDINNFGQYANMLSQCKDSRFTGLSISDNLEPPVIIKFVSGAISNVNETSFKKYYLLDPHESTAEGNKSIFSTSSFGFMDNNIGSVINLSSTPINSNNIFFNPTIPNLFP